MKNNISTAATQSSNKCTEAAAKQSFEIYKSANFNYNDDITFYKNNDKC